MDWSPPGAPYLFRDVWTQLRPIRGVREDARADGAGGQAEMGNRTSGWVCCSEPGGTPGRCRPGGLESARPVGGAGKIEAPFGPREFLIRAAAATMKTTGAMAKQAGAGGFEPLDGPPLSRLEWMMNSLKDRHDGGRLEKQKPELWSGWLCDPTVNARLVA